MPPEHFDDSGGLLTFGKPVESCARDQNRKHGIRLHNLAQKTPLIGSN